MQDGTRPIDRMARIIQAALREDGYPNVEVSSRGNGIFVEGGVWIDDVFEEVMERTWRLANRRPYADRSCCVPVYLIAWTVVATGEFVLLSAPNIGWDAR